MGGREIGERLQRGIEGRWRRYWEEWWSLLTASVSKYGGGVDGRRYTYRWCIERADAAMGRIGGPGRANAEAISADVKTHFPGYLGRADAAAGSAEVRC